MMEKLITVADIKLIRPISNNINPVDLIEPYISEAQRFDIQPVLDCSDEEFLQEIIDNKGDGDIYDALIVQITPVLAYYSYARYLQNVGVKVTNAGVVHKKTEWSEPADERTISRLVTQAQSSALAYQKILTDFLDDNKTDYPNWKCSQDSGRRKSGARIRAVGGNDAVDDSDQCYEGIYII